ncbi:MAG TPA: DNA mismatch repair endonuclease MutL, partial [Ruminococcus sp.]|nr:DNA mismatch repair endonuclease MutL [Ruminococcus sp.]
MGVINVLDKHVAELIAAGEVVERPASVIKELIENSIDAGAKNITVEIKNGGTTFMRVADDGCGIWKDDIKVAFLRHATSKVKLESDLDCISTLGFRGEALASICAVSRLQLITRNKNEDIGTCYEINGGEEVSFDDAGCPIGTTFVIRDLFYNIPARAKFLKKDVSEGNAVSNIIDKTALSHPEIAFTYIRDGKQVLKTFGDGKLLSAIYSVFGRDFANGLIPVEYQLDAIKVYGYVSKPQNSRPNRNMQNFFINGRYVKTRTAMAAVEEAFKGSVMVGKYPSCVLNIEVPFEMIDVNVHPAKIEVRFINERPVFDTVYHAIKSSLLKNDSRKNANFKTDTVFNEIKDSRKFNPFRNAPAIFNKSTANTADAQKQEYSPKSKNEFNPFDEINYVSSPKKEEKIITQINDDNNLLSEKRKTSKINIDSLKIADSDKPFDIYSKEAINNSYRE